MLHQSISLEDLKQQAKSVRRSLDHSGQVISHSRSLEVIAHQYGYRDWNTLYAALGNRSPTPLQIGQIVSGTYLGQKFSGEIIALRMIAGGQNYRVTVRFEEPVDVVTFDSFSAFRRQVNATIDQYGRTIEKTSNGAPQMVLNMH